MARIAIVGGGAWGTALAAHAAKLGHDVALWAREPEVVRDVTTLHENPSYLPDVALPERIGASTDACAVASGRELVVCAAPSRWMRSVVAEVAPAVDARAVVLVAAKGIEAGTLSLMTDVVGEAAPALGRERVAVLAGPSFAREVALGLPTDVVVAGEDGATFAAQRALHAPSFRVYTSDDPIGAQIGGALKNVVAIAAGACDGLRLGQNARAALVTRGLSEMTRLGVALGARALTFLGLAGVGDLMLTCAGDDSRNRDLGRRIAEGIEPAAFLAAQRTVAEGWYTAAAVVPLAAAVGVEVPIAAEVHAVLHEGKPLRAAMRALLARPEKRELEGIHA